MIPQLDPDLIRLAKTLSNELENILLTVAVLILSIFFINFFHISRMVPAIALPDLASRAAAEAAHQTLSPWRLLLQDRPVDANGNPISYREHIIREVRGDPTTSIGVILTFVAVVFLLVLFYPDVLRPVGLAIWKTVWGILWTWQSFPKYNSLYATAVTALVTLWISWGGRKTWGAISRLVRTPSAGLLTVLPKIGVIKARSEDIFEAAIKAHCWNETILNRLWWAYAGTLVVAHYLRNYGENQCRDPNHRTADSREPLSMNKPAYFFALVSSILFYGMVVSCAVLFLIGVDNPLGGPTPTHPVK